MANLWYCVTFGIVIAVVMINMIYFEFLKTILLINIFNILIKKLVMMLQVIIDILMDL